MDLLKDPSAPILERHMCLTMIHDPQRRSLGAMQQLGLRINRDKYEYEMYCLNAGFV